MLRSVELKDYMLANPIRVKADTPLFDAVHLILVNKVSGLCVVNDEDQLVGILSELDCLKAILSATYNESGVGPVSEYMANDNLITADPHEDIVDIAMEMVKNKRRRRPVVENGQLVGQITVRQLLRAVKEFAAPFDASEH